MILDSAGSKHRDLENWPAGGSTDVAGSEREFEEARSDVVVSNLHNNNVIS